jgi:hypothetical protein
MQVAMKSSSKHSLNREVKTDYENNGEASYPFSRNRTRHYDPRVTGSNKKGLMI